MKKNILLYTLLVLFTVVFSACSQKENQMPEELSKRTEIRVLSVNLAPSTDTRAIIKDLNSKNVFFRWEVGNFDLNIVFKQNEVLKIVRGVQIKSAKGENCSFDVELPEGIDPIAPFDLYGVVAEDIKVKNGKILVGVGAHSLYELTAYSSNRDGAVPIWFKSQNVSLKDTEVDANFEHLGAMAVVTIKNNSEAALKTAGFAVRPANDGAEFYLKGALPFEGNTALPYIDLLNLSETPEEILTRVVYPSVDIAPGDIAYVGFWFRPNDLGTTPEINLVAYDARNRQPIVSANTRSARDHAMQVGKAYNIYAQWDGKELVMQDEPIEKELPENQPKIILTIPEDAIGTPLPLIIGAAGPEAERDVWIDLNNNQLRDPGEYVTEFSSVMKADNVKMYTSETKTITIYGGVTDFCYFGEPGPKLESINTLGNPVLNQLFVFESSLGAVDLTANTKLTRVAFEKCELTTITMPQTAEDLQELYLNDNQLGQVDISSAPNLLGFSFANNQLTSVTYPAFTTLWVAELQGNQLNEAALNIFFHRLQKAGQKYAEWMYTAQIYNNPGAAGANKSLAIGKGWTVISADPDAPAPGTTQTTARLLMPIPLKSRVK